MRSVSGGSGGRNGWIYHELKALEFLNLSSLKIDLLLQEPFAFAVFGSPDIVWQAK